jgi:hypothetical protein
VKNKEQVNASVDQSAASEYVTLGIADQAELDMGSGVGVL